MRPELSIVIPVKNAAAYLPDLLTALSDQENCGPLELLLLDSCSTDDTLRIARELWPDVRVESIATFSHGGTRNRGVELARGELVVLMTQDALPMGRNWLERLTAPLREDATVAAAYSRHIPRADASLLEQHHIETQFPEQAVYLRRCVAGETPGVEMCFLSNVSAVYRRELLLRHPFDPDLIMGEDQQAARDLLRHGYAIAYAADSRVIHSHDYNSRQTFKRYFDSAVANRDLFPPGSVRHHNRAALRGHLRRVRTLLLRNPLLLPHLLWNSAVKTLALTLGHHSQHLPRAVCQRLSMHPYHWQSRKLN